MVRKQSAFTLVEMLVVMAIVGLLLTIAVPRYMRSVDQSRENVLRHNLIAIRVAIDQFDADQGKLPQTLEDLVARRYLRQVPKDPITDRSDTWQVLKHPASAGDSDVRIHDVRSGALGTGSDGTAYASW